MNRANITFCGIDSKDLIPINHRPQYDLLAGELQRRYGNRLKMQFVNTLGQEMLKLHQNWHFFSIDKLPLVLLNGKPLCCGKVQREKIFYEIDNILRPRWSRFR